MAARTGELLVLLSKDKIFSDHTDLMLRTRLGLSLARGRHRQAAFVWKTTPVLVILAVLSVVSVAALFTANVILLRLALLGALAVLGCAVVATHRLARDVALQDDTWRQEQDGLRQRLEEQQARADRNQAVAQERGNDNERLRVECQQHLAWIRDSHGHIERLEGRLRETTRYGIQLRTYTAQLMNERSQQAEQLAAATAAAREAERTVQWRPRSAPPLDLRRFESAHAVLSRLVSSDWDGLPGVPVGAVSTRAPAVAAPQVIPAGQFTPVRSVTVVNGSADAPGATVHRLEPVAPVRPPAVLGHDPAIRERWYDTVDAGEPITSSAVEPEQKTSVVLFGPPSGGHRGLADQVIDLTAEDDTQPLDLAELRRRA
jgi:hypothetical protein